LAIPILAMLGQDLAKGGMGFRLSFALSLLVAGGVPTARSALINDGNPVSVGAPTNACARLTVWQWTSNSSFG
jgi:hypothetical protein